MRFSRRFNNWSRTKKIVVLGVIAGLLIGGGTVAVVLKIEHDNQVAAKQKKEKEEHAQLVAEKRAAVKAAERKQKAEEGFELSLRQELVKSMQHAIQKDAEKEVLEEEIEGPILKTECEPEGGEISLTEAAQAFRCLVVTTETGGQSEGYRYTATANYNKESYTWRFGGE